MISVCWPVQMKEEIHYMNNLNPGKIVAIFPVPEPKNTIIIDVFAGEAVGADSHGIPRFVNAGYIQPDKIGAISKFRSGIGHDCLWIYPRVARIAGAWRTNTPLSMHSDEEGGLGGEVRCSERLRPG